MVRKLVKRLLIYGINNRKYSNKRNQHDIYGRTVTGIGQLCRGQQSGNKSNGGWIIRHAGNKLDRGPARRILSFQCGKREPFIRREHNRISRSTMCILNLLTIWRS